MTWTDTITKYEKEAIETLKRLTINDCSPNMLEDETLFYRFLKARDFNLKDAEEMLRNHISWRKEYQIDTIIKDYKAPEILKKYSPVSNIGFDKEGDLIKYIDIGRADSPGLINSCKKNDIVKYNLQLNEIDLEKLRQQSKKLGKTVNKITFIYNFDKMTFAKVTNKKALDLMILGAKMYQDNYPEIIKYIYFINNGYQESLMELADADIIPAFLGGNRTDSDGNPNCHEIIIYGEDVPRELYFRKSERRLSSSPGVKKLTVTRFSKSDIRFEVREPGSLFEWEFETKSRDIGFGVYFQGSPDSKIEELVPKQRIDTDVEPETGVYKCVKAGTYIIVFDNSYSWLYPKHIFYRARIISPQDEESIPWK